MVHKKFLRDSSIRWIFNLHYIEYLRFRYKFIDKYSWDNFEYIVKQKHPGEFKIILEGEEILRMPFKINYIVKSFTEGFRLMLVSGARDSGKTCFAFWLVEEIHKRIPYRKIVYVGVTLDEGLLPDWIENMDMFEYERKAKADALFNYIIILDEMAIHFNARKWQSDENIVFSQLIAISRHKHLSMIAIAQDFSTVETNVWKNRDMVVYKKSNTYELIDRDSKGSSKTSKTIQFWKYIKNWYHPKSKRQALFEYQSEKQLLLIEHPKASFWTQELSEGFNKFNVFEKKEEQSRRNKEKKGVDEY